MSATDYCIKIDHLISTMFYLEGKVQATNRNAVDAYLHTTWESVMALTHSIQKQDNSDALRAKFESYVEAEEERLRSNLEDIRYHIDDFATVSLVAGPGRIEMVRGICLPHVSLF